LFFIKKNCKFGFILSTKTPSVMFRNLRSRLLIGLVIAAFTFFQYYSKRQVNPVTGKTQHISMTPAQEVAMGLQSAPQMAAEFGGLLQNADVQRKVKAVGAKLVNSTDAKNSPYQFDFHVLADPETINAFALPGGQIFITVGLLKRLQTEDQLAGVIGHEIGHVIGRHSAQQMAKSELTSGLMNAAVMATQDPYSSGNSAAIAQYVGNVVNMKFGRDDELESDKFGVKFMLQAGYQPESMIAVMEVLKQAAGPNRPSEFQSTHPDPDHRIAEIKKMLERYRNGQPLE
jgi:predicted Zn-dependent protease